MAFSFDPELPAARDRARLAVGDTDPANPLRGDETVDALLALHGERLGTAALAEGLAAEFARKPSSFGSGGMTVAWAERVKTWLQLAARLRGGDGSGATAGGFVAGRDDLVRSEYVRPAAGAWWTA